MTEAFRTTFWNRLINKTDEPNMIKYLMDFLINRDIQPFMILMSQSEYNGSKRFKFTYAESFEQMQMILESSDDTFHEKFPSNVNVRPYMDIDLNAESPGFEEYTEMGHDSLIAFLRETISCLFVRTHELDVERVRVCIMSACREEKISFHVILPDYTYADVESAKQFAEICAEHIHGVDLAPYGAWASLRLCGQSKPNGEGRLAITDGDFKFEDTFITNCSGPVVSFSREEPVVTIDPFASDFSVREVGQMIRDYEDKFSAYELICDDPLDIGLVEMKRQLDLLRDIHATEAESEKAEYGMVDLKFGSEFVWSDEFSTTTWKWTFEGFAEMISYLNAHTYVHTNGYLLFRCCAAVLMSNRTRERDIKRVLNRKLALCGSTDAECEGVCKFMSDHSHSVDSLLATEGVESFNVTLMIRSAMKQKGGIILEKKSVVNRLMNAEAIMSENGIDDDNLTFITLVDFMIKHKHTVFDEHSVMFYKHRLMQLIFGCIRFWTADANSTYVIKTRGVDGSKTWIQQGPRQLRDTIRACSFTVNKKEIITRGGAEIEKVKSEKIKLFDFIGEYEPELMITNVICRPNARDVHGRTLNIFCPFKPEYGVMNFDHMTLVRPWVKLFNHLIPDEPSREWLMNWFRGMVQTNTLLEMVPYIFGERGVGKGLVMRPFLEMMSSYATVTSNLNSLHSHSGQLLNKRLLICDEIGWQTVSSNAFQSLKAWVTNMVISLRKLFRDTQDVYNVLSVVITGNDARTLPIESKTRGRRFIYIRSNRRKMDSEDYDAFTTALHHPLFKQAFYKYITDVPFDMKLHKSGITLERHQRIVTSLANETSKLEWDWINAFIREYCDGSVVSFNRLTSRHYTQMHIVNHYKAYCEENMATPKAFNYVMRSLNHLCTAASHEGSVFQKMRVMKDGKRMSVFKFDKEAVTALIKYFEDDDEPVINEEELFDDGGEGSA